MHFVASFYIIQSQGCHILSCFKPWAESSRQLKELSVQTHSVLSVPIRKASGDLEQVFWLTILRFPPVLLTVHAAAAPSASPLCQPVMCLWKLCWPCLETAPNPFFYGFPGKEGWKGRQKRWWESKQKVLGAHKLTSNCQENK